MAALSLNLLQAVRRLAASPEGQQAYLRQLGTAPSTDELALEFSDALMLEKGLLDDVVRAAAVQLDEQLAGMSGPQHEELWTLAALHTSEEWARVRELAAETLRRDDELR